MNNEWTAWIQTVILALTAGVVFWYTLETYWLRKEAVHQRRILLRPVIVPQFEQLTEISREFLILQNIGAGTALNVQVEPIVSEDHPDALSWTFDLVSYIAPGKEAGVPSQHTARSKLTTAENTRSSFMPKYASQPHEMNVRFEDTEGGKYWIPIRKCQAKTVSRERFEIGPIHYEERS